jgi:hypothetical protein
MKWPGAIPAIFVVSGAKRPWRHASLANGGSVAVIGAAAATKNTHLGERAPERDVSPAEIGGVARIERFGFVELGVAFRRGIRPEAMDALRPGLTCLQGIFEMRGVRTVDQEIFDRAIGLAIHGLDSLA